MKTEKLMKANAHKLFKFIVFWEWTDIALCLRIYRQSEFSDYYIGIDFQILWFNLWIQCFKKPHTNIKNK